MVIDVKRSSVPFIATPAALRFLKAKVGESNKQFVRVLGLGGGPSGLGFTATLTAKPIPEEQMVVIGGLRFCYDPNLVTVLQDVVLDIDGEGEEQALVFRNKRKEDRE